jgi:hypothetical protein
MFTPPFSAASPRNARARRLLAVIAAAALTVAGVTVVGVLETAPASASVTPGVKPDIELSSGQKSIVHHDDVLFGSAESKGTPDDCRNNPASGVSCKAFRLKLHRSPGVPLIVALDWDAQGDSAVLQVPDVDMYLFTTPTSSVDSTLYGGAGSTMPETLKIAPAQDEYDIVVQAYAGAITGFTLRVYYTTEPLGVAPGIPADITLTPNQKPIKKLYNTVMVTSPRVFTTSGQRPAECRSGPKELLCDVYRVKLNRNRSPDAYNFVVMTLEWDAGPVIPAVAVAVTATGERQIPNLDMLVYDTPDHFIPTDDAGGDGLLEPEQVAFAGTQDEFDVVIQASEGTATSYTLSAKMSDEIFDKPFEFLDDLGNAAGDLTPAGGLYDGSGKGADNIPTIPGLALAPIGVDDSISGIGLGTTESFDAATLSQRATRNAAAISEPPSGLVLVLALIAIPAAILGGVVVVLRRRRALLF